MKIPIYVFPEMFNNTNHVLNFDINKIKFDDSSYKKNNKHVIDMYYKNNYIIFQLPRQKLSNVNKDIITLELNDTTINEYIIKPLEEHICEMTHKYSVKWFNGNHFTMNKIVNSLDSRIKKTNGIFTLDLLINKNTLLYDRYKTLIEFDQINMNFSNIELITLVRLSNLEFIDNKFTYSLILEQAKVYINEYFSKYSIIETNNNVSTNVESSVAF